MKWLLLILLTSTFLRANNLDNEELSSIYTEALIFVAVFAVMSIISFIVSTKQAKKYLQKKPPSPKEEGAQLSPLNDTDNRISELSKLVDGGLLTDEEFQILKQAKGLT